MSRTRLRTPEGRLGTVVDLVIGPAGAFLGVQWDDEPRQLLPPSYPVAMVRQWRIS